MRANRLPFTASMRADLSGSLVRKIWTYCNVDLNETKPNSRPALIIAIHLFVLVETKGSNVFTISRPELA